MSSKLRTTKWSGEILDAGDGTGDGILELPIELTAQLGWQEGDKLSVTLTAKNILMLNKLDDDQPKEQSPGVE